MAEVTCIADGLGFPEGPIFLPDGSLLVVEIQNGQLTRIEPGGDMTVIAQLGGGPNGAALAPDGRVIICNNGGFSWHQGDGLIFPTGAASDYISGSIQKVDLESGSVETLLTQVDGRSLSGPNDLVFDEYGGFYFTDTGKHWETHSDNGRICYVSDSNAWTVASPLAEPNGIGLSPDGKRLYVSETATARLWWWYVDAPGVLRGGETFFGSGGGNFLFGESRYRLLDSLAIEASGHVCACTLLEAGVSIVNPAGDLVDRVDLDAVGPAITNIAFGGADMRDAYLTASATGCVYHMRWPRSGLRLN
ncbi:SMP-30/gluconolactonase/LRE family protein [Parasphingorhabdus sp.]|uniref:SMP-30/gluconolactonase/LRE family protein n=1 Tax=Parasphingorhabdus sp. TaxID=2709688 RepID=UPI003A92952F